MLLRRCEHCDWCAVTSARTRLLQMYRDHLRTDHPQRVAESDAPSSVSAPNGSGAYAGVGDAD